MGQPDPVNLSGLAAPVGLAGRSVTDLAANFPSGRPDPAVLSVPSVMVPPVQSDPPDLSALSARARLRRASRSHRADRADPVAMDRADRAGPRVRGTPAVMDLQVLWAPAGPGVPASTDLSGRVDPRILPDPPAPPIRAFLGLRSDRMGRADPPA